MILTASATVLLFQLRESGMALRFWLYIMIACGLLLRVESGLIGVLISQIGILLFTTEGKRCFLQNVPVYVFILALLFFINWPRNAAEQQYLSIRPYQFTLWDYHPAHSGLKLLSIKDSIKYATARRSFLADDEMLTPAFFESIGLQKTDKTPADFAGYLQVSPEQRTRMLRYFDVYIKDRCGIFFFFVMALMQLLYISKQRKQILLLTGLNLGGLILMAIFMKMELHLYYPLLCLSLLLPYTLSNYHVEHHQEKVLKVGAYLGLAALLWGLIPENIQFYKRKRSLDLEMKAVKAELSIMPEKTIVLVFKTPLVNWHMRMFQKEPDVGNAVRLPVDNGLLFVQKEHQNFLKAQLGCSELGCYIHAAMNAPEVFILSDSTRHEIMCRYIRQMHGISFKSEIDKVKESPERIRTGHEAFHFYRVFSSTTRGEQR
jgi:hypothetical protein